MSIPMGGAGALGRFAPFGPFAPHGPFAPGVVPRTRAKFAIGFSGHRFPFTRGAFEQQFPFFPFGPWAYPFVGSEEPQVVFVPEPPEEVPPPPPHIVEPKIINVPATAEPQAPPRPKLATALVWRDGRQEQVRRYAIIGSTLFDYTDPHKTRRIPLDALDLDATVAVNQQHGVAFRIPATANEIAVNF